MKSFVAVVPARMASTRLPGKPLADLGGRPMVVRVAEQALLSGAAEVWVATDDVRVQEAVESFGMRAVLTQADHPSGTDRLAEVVDIMGWDDSRAVVNVQGDEPLMDPVLITRVAEALATSRADIATAAHPIHCADDLFNPNVVKLVCDRQGDALYFSRAPIPWARDAWSDVQQRGSIPVGLPVLRHIGLYAYRASFLKSYRQLEPSPLEYWEALEQLRALAHGYRIHVVTTDEAPPAGVDTPDDLERVRRVFQSRPR